MTGGRPATFLLLLLLCVHAASPSDLPGVTALQSLSCVINNSGNVARLSSSPLPTGKKITISLTSAITRVVAFEAPQPTNSTGSARIARVEFYNSNSFQAVCGHGIEGSRNHSFTGGRRGPNLQSIQFPSPRSILGLNLGWTDALFLPAEPWDDVVVTDINVWYNDLPCKAGNVKMMNKSITTYLATQTNCTATCFVRCMEKNATVELDPWAATCRVSGPRGRDISPSVEHALTVAKSKPAVLGESAMQAMGAIQNRLL